MALGNGKGGNVYQNASNNLNLASMGTMGAATGMGVGAAMNPYIGSVVGSSMDALERSRELALGDNAAKATAAGAFGGSRHGIIDSETNKNFFDSAGSMVSNLMKSGWDTAQTNLMNGASQLGNLANLGFGMGQQVDTSLGQQGALKQGLNQALIDAGKGQYSGWTGAGLDGLKAMLTAVGAGNMGQQTQTTTQKPGLLNYLSLLLAA